MKSVKASANQEINWSKIQLLECDSVVVLTTGNHKGHVFEGTVVHSVKGSYFSVGHYSDSWNKDAFELFNDKIELSND